jgi:hypothetical protein
MKTFSAVLVICMLISITRLSAQHAGDFGLGVFINSSSNITATYHISERFAIRPAIGFSLQATEDKRNSTINDYDNNTNSHQKGINGSINLLSYLPSSTPFSIYITIGAGYSITNQEETTRLRSQYSDTTETYSSDGNGYSGRAGFGMQYAIGGRVVVFGELSVGYSRSSSDTDGGSTTSFTSSQFGISTSGLGFTFYLN